MRYEFLHSKATAEMYELIERLNREQGITVIIRVCRKRVVWYRFRLLAATEKRRGVPTLFLLTL